MNTVNLPIENNQPRNGVRRFAPGLKRMHVMNKGTTTLPHRARDPSVMIQETVENSPIGSMAARTGQRPSISSASHIRLLHKLILGTLVPFLAAISLFGCEASVRKANITEPTEAKTPNTSMSISNRPRVVTIPSGTTLLVSLNTTLRTDREMSGDVIIARLYNAVIVNRVVVLPTGAQIRGRLLVVSEPYSTSGRAQMTLVFDRLVGPYGKIHPISTAPIVFVGECDKAGAEDYSAAGSAISFVSASFEGSRSRAGRAANERAASSADGAIAFATTSKQIELPTNQRFMVDLEAPLQVSVYQLTAGR